MIKTLHNIGEILQQDKEYKGYFEPWQNAYKDSDKAKVIIIDVRDGIINKPILENYANSKSDKYLFRPAPGRATNLVPTFYFYLSRKADVEKWEKEQKINVKKIIDKTKASFKNNNHKFLQKNEIEKLSQLLLDFSREKLDKGDAHLITFKIDGKYFGDFSENRDLFYDEAYARYYKKVYGKAKMENYPCALTGKNSTVYGFVDTLGFTVNDKAFMRNGFNQNHAYKMFPVSEEAVVTLEGAMSFATEQIESAFYKNIKYLILPQFIGKTSSAYSEKVIETFINKCALNINIEDGEKGVKGFITESENYIKEIIEDEILHEQVNYEILFYARNNSQLGLLLHLTDVVPSHLRKINFTKQILQNYYKGITNVAPKDKKPGYIFRINLYKIKDFFSTEQGLSKVPTPFFYRITEAIFCNQTVNKQLVIDFLIKDFRKKFKQRNDKYYLFASSVKEGFVLLQFFTQLGLFNNENQQIMDNTIEEKVALNAIQFIEQHSSFFGSEYKKGAFLFGCLVTRLLYNQPGNAFLKELNNLNIDKELINKKFPKLIDKLRKYKKYFPELESEAARYFAINDKVNKDEISMAFTLGMVLQSDFDSKNKKNKEEDDKSKSSS